MRGWLAAERGGARLDTLLAARLPKRFAQAFCEALGAARPLAELGAAKREAVARALSAWEVLPSGTLGWNKAEVTLGGVDTRGLSSKTMQANAVPGLLLRRRGGGRHRLAGRLQLPVGVGVRPRGGYGGLTGRLSRASDALCASIRRFVPESPP